MKSLDEPNTNPPSQASDQATFDPAPLLHAFEQAWQAGDTPPIQTLMDRLPADAPAGEPARRRLLEEMVKIDLEYRWRGFAPRSNEDLPPRPLLEDYLRCFPSLGSLDRLSLELIGEEYRVRRTWGDRPKAESYYVRFAGHDGLPSLLARIDAELAQQAVQTTLMTQSPRGTPSEVIPDGYELLGELGRGGMGVVYKARQVSLHRLVAIKMIRAGDEAGPADLARFHTEAEAAARVQHPHVVQVYEIGEKAGQPFCVMEYVNGGSLARRLAGTPLEPRAAARLLETLARAVQAIHDQGILHRDLKPANILLHVSNPDDSATLTPALLQSPAFVPKIGDFGLAKPAEAVGLTQTGVVLGTPSYMAPEQAESRSAAIGPATDVYGLGAILYELLTGRPPFRGVTILETLEQVRNREPLPPRQLQPAVPRDLETICLKSLQKDPSKRYTSAAALAEDLERFRLNQPIHARPAGRWERGLKWARRRPALATLAATIILAIAAALAGGFTYTLHLQAARAETERQRQQAGRSYRKSLQAVEQMLVRMGAERMEAIPGTEKAQEDALTDAIGLYQELLDEQERPDPDLYARLGFALTYLGNRQMALGRPKEAEKNCRRGMELLDNLPADLRDTRACQHQSAFSRYILGNLLTAKNQRTEAERLYLEACDILASRGDDRDARHLLSGCYTALGALNNHPAQNVDYYRQAVELREDLHKKDPDNWYYRNGLGESLFNLARNSLSAGRAEEAETLFQRCIALLEPFVARSAKANDQPAARLRSQTTLLHCYTGLGMLRANRATADKAESFYRKAIAVSEELVRLYPDPARRQELAQGYLDLGVMYQINQQRKKAEEMYRKAAAIQEVLARDLPDIPYYRLNLAKTYANLSLMLDGARVDEAFAVLQKGRDLLEPLMRAHADDPRFANDYGNLCNNQALVLYYRNEPRKALPWHDRAVEVLTAAHRRHPADAVCTGRCMTALGARAVTWRALGEHKKALADWDQLMEVVGPVEADKYRWRRAATLIELSDHRQAAEDIDKALRRRGISDDERYNCVCLLSHTLATALKDPHLAKEERNKAADRYVARALEELTQLQRKGYFRDPKKWLQFGTDENLAALRERDDFKRWCRK